MIFSSVSDTDESEENPSYTKLLVSPWRKTLESDALWY